MKSAKKILREKADLEQEIINDLGIQFAKSQDFLILADVLCQFGWTRVDTHYNIDQTWYEVKAWAAENCRGETKEHVGHWLFENPADATWFKLRWL